MEKIKPSDEPNQPPPGDPNQPSPGDPNEPPREHIHFARGQFGLVVRHRSNIAAREIIRRLQASGLFRIPPDANVRQKSNGRASILAGDDQPVAYFSPERVTTFDPSRFDTPAEGNPRAFSLVFADVPALRDETLLLAYLTQLYPKISEQFKDKAADFFVEPAATPNWLSCASGETDGSGGPGGRPVPPRGALEEGFQREQGALPDKLDIKKPHGQRGEAVHVFILDTAPCEVDLRRAFRKWVTGAPRNGNRPNPQLAALIGPNGALRDSLGRLQIDYAGHSHLLEGVNAFLPDHDYVMSDHGLFVASIINALAPAAKLHLIEVLNPYGVGTLESIARGFARAADFILKNPGATVVVNASLFLGVVQKDQAAIDELAKIDPFWARFKEGDIDGLVAPLREVCAFIHTHVGRVAAAAGNDGRIRTNGDGQVEDFHPAARFPAAYENVVGVAALNLDDSIAIYTNLADLQGDEGIATFGGDKIGEDSDPEKGVLGVYIGSFPDGTPNRFGLARWSGTSFATPRVTAAFVALMSDGVSQRDAFKRIRDIPVVGEPRVGGEVLPQK